MPLTVDFSYTQVVGQPSKIVLTDASTGTDATVSQRRVYIVDSQNNYLVPDGTATDYVEWGDFPATTSKTIDCLTKDMAVNITTQWLTSGNVVVYTKTELCRFTLYNEQFLYDLTTDQSSNPNIIQDTTYYTNKAIMRTEVDAGNQAVDLASDISGAQGAYDRATSMRLSSNYYF